LNVSYHHYLYIYETRTELDPVLNNFQNLVLKMHPIFR